MNIPNKLTMLRILLIPVFMFFSSYSNSANFMLIAAIIFIIASLTDFFDGWYARKYNIVTDFGKFCDPLADKLLTTTAFIYMMQLNACDPIVIVIILAREFAVSGVRMVVASAPNGKVIAANIWGKLKTVLQMVTIILFYLYYSFDLYFNKGSGSSIYQSQILAYIMCWLVAILTAVSGIIYLWQSREYINTAK